VTPIKEHHQKLGKKRAYEAITPDDDVKEPPAKRNANEDLQKLYEQMLASRAKAKKDEVEWKNCLH